MGVGFIYMPCALSAAEGDIYAPPVEVIGHYETGVGTSDAASAGAVTNRLIEDRPILRPGEILEFVPGMVVTQHSGDGKANQYFLRGYNLDHGTDFGVYVDGMPVNMPTHGHGQGYADINFMIAELVSRIDFRKGPYYAEDGDFSSAGSARFRYYDRLPASLASITLGSNDYQRAVLASSPQVGNGNLLIAVEGLHNDGPWDNPESFNKVNGVLRLTQGDAVNGFSLAGMAYNAHWNSTDQIPQRAVDQGLIGRFGAIDPSDGGETYRYSVSFQGHRALSSLGGPQFDVDAFIIRYGLDLFSNFSYFTDPVNGDQFQQADRRTVYGLRPSLTWAGQLGSFETVNKVGVQIRHDDIDRVALYRTQGREVFATTREDQVRESSIGVFAENTMQWTSWLRSIAGVRADFYEFDVDSSIAQNSGSQDDHIVSPKLSFVLGPWSKTEYFLNLGYGFHSNDARGTTITIDPQTLTPAEPVTPLVRTKGAEVGLRTEIVPGLQSSLSIWYLEQDSELLFIGDAGTTEPSRPSQREGIEWTNYYRPLAWLLFDAELSWSRARFKDSDPAGDHIPGAVPFVAQFGVTVQDLRRWSGSLQVRHISRYPLIEDDSVRARSSTIANLRIGYEFNRTWSAGFDVLNLFDRKANDINYFYCSRLPSDPGGATCSDGTGGVDDIHFHPAERRQFRFTVSARF